MKIVAALLALGLLVAATAPEPTRVGVVDLDAIFEALPQKAAVEAELTTFIEDARKRVEKLQADRAAKVQERSLLDKETTAYRDLSRQILGIEADIQFEQQSTARELERRKTEQHEKLLATTQSAIDEYATQHGFDVILQREMTGAGGGPKWAAVLYAKEGVDVTAAVIAELKAN